MNYRIFSFLALALTLTASFAAAPVGAQESKALFWVFLNRGSSQTPLPKEEAERLQAAHVGNLGKLGEQGKALTAGPLGDNGLIRGIVVLTVRTPEEVSECFREDPFVQQSRLAVESYRWLADKKKFHKPNTPFKIVQFSLGIVKKGPQWQASKGDIKADLLEKLLPSLKSLARSHDLAVSGPLLDANELVGILLFRTPDQARIKAVLDKDASVQTGRVTVELHPQWLGEGVFGK